MKAFLKAVGMFSSGLAAFVPLAKCAVCATAAGGVLTSLGVATIGIEPWFVPVLAILLLIGLWGFFQTSQQHGKWQWFCLAAAASAMVLGGRLAELPFLVWSGGFVLVVVYLFDLGAKQKWRQNL